MASPQRARAAQTRMPPAGLWRALGKRSSMLNGSVQGPSLSQSRFGDSRPKSPLWLAAGSPGSAPPRWLGSLGTAGPRCGSCLRKKMTICPGFKLLPGRERFPSASSQTHQRNENKSCLVLLATCCPHKTILSSTTLGGSGGVNTLLRTTPSYYPPRPRAARRLGSPAPRHS